MVASKESLSSLDLSGGPSTHMVDDSPIPTIGKGSIKFEHGVFKNVLYVPSLAANMLSVYQMNHSSSPNRVIFDPDSVEISEISTRNLIVKGAANHAFKEYEFSHFLPNSYPSTLLTHSNDIRRIGHEIFG